MSTLTVARLAARKIIEATDARADALLRAKHAENAAEAHAHNARAYGQRIESLLGDNDHMIRVVAIRAGITDTQAAAAVRAVHDHLTDPSWPVIR